MMSTTIQLKKNTKISLEKQKLYPTETFDAVILRLIQSIDDELTPEIIKNIEEGVADIKAGKTHTTEQLNKKLDL